jgi:Helix-turn-helix domain
MSYLHTNWVRDDIEFRGLKEDGKTIVPMMDTFPRAIMYALASRANKGGYCEVSQEDLAGDTGMSVRSVRRYIKKIPTTVLQIIRQGGSPKTEERYPTQFRVMYPGNSNDPGPVDRGQRNGNDKFMEATPVCQSTTPDYQTGVPGPVVRQTPDSLSALLKKKRIIRKKKKE